MKYCACFVCIFLLIVSALSPVEAARGRVKIVNGNVVADNGVPLRGEAHFVLTRGYSWNDLRTRWHLNTVRLYLYRSPVNGEIKTMKPVTEDIKVIDKYVNEAAREGFYLIIDYHAVGGHDGDGKYGGPWKPFEQKDAYSWWSAVAPRYKDRTHVLYEANNEPVAWLPTQYEATDLDYQKRLYQLIRSKAPDTHIIMWSFAKATTGMISKVEAVPEIKYDNASVGLHMYSYSVAEIIGLKSRGYPVINTEIGGYNNDDYVQTTLVNENMKLSWIWLNGYRENLDMTWPADPQAIVGHTPVNDREMVSAIRGINIKNMGPIACDITGKPVDLDNCPTGIYIEVNDNSVQRTLLINR